MAESPGVVNSPRRLPAQAPSRACDIVQGQGVTAAPGRLSVHAAAPWPHARSALPWHLPTEASWRNPGTVNGPRTWPRSSSKGPPLHQWSGGSYPVRSCGCLAGPSLPSVEKVTPRSSRVGRWRNIDRFPARTSKKSARSTSTNRTASPPTTAKTIITITSSPSIMTANETYGPECGLGSAAWIVQPGGIWGGRRLDSRGECLVLPGVQQAGALGQRGGLHPVMDAEFAQDVADVHAGRGRADV